MSVLFRIFKEGITKGKKQNTEKLLLTDWNNFKIFQQITSVKKKKITIHLFGY